MIIDDMPKTYLQWFLHMFKMPIFQGITIMLDQSITLLPFLHMYHSIFLRGRHHLHWIMLPLWPCYHNLHRIFPFYQHHQKTLAMKKLFSPYYCFTLAAALVATIFKFLLIPPYTCVSIRTWPDVKVTKFQCVLLLSKRAYRGLWLFCLLVSKFGFVLRGGGLSFSWPGCDLRWCQYPEFVTAVLQTGQIA